MRLKQHERFLHANRELRDFLARVNGLANGTCWTTEKDLQALSRRLANVAPEVGDASRAGELDTTVQIEIAEYVQNLRALQLALERVRCLMTARKAQIEADLRHLEGLHGWVQNFPQPIG